MLGHHLSESSHNSDLAFQSDYSKPTRNDSATPSQRDTRESSCQGDQPSPDDDQIPSVSLTSLSSETPCQRLDTDTSDEDVEFAEDSLQISILSDPSSSLHPSFSPPKPERRRYNVPTDPSEYESALSAAIEADRRTAHLSSSEFELTFEVQYTTNVITTQPGEKIAVIGSLDLLGAWSPANSLEMEWTPGHVWRLTITLAEGVLPQFEYKFLCVSPRGVRWESGPNRSFVPEKFTDVHGPKVIYALKTKWQA